MSVRNFWYALLGGWALSFGYFITAAAIYAASTYRPRFWRRAVIRRELRALADERRFLRAGAAAAERRHREGHHDAGRHLAAVAYLLDDVDRDIDRALDLLDQLK